MHPRGAACAIVRWTAGWPPLQHVSLVFWLQTTIFWNNLLVAKFGCRIRKALRHLPTVSCLDLSRGQTTIALLAHDASWPQLNGLRREPPAESIDSAIRGRLTSCFYNPPITQLKKSVYICFLCFLILLTILKLTGWFHPVSGSWSLFDSIISLHRLQEISCCCWRLHFGSTGYDWTLIPWQFYVLRQIIECLSASTDCRRFPVAVGDFVLETISAMLAVKVWLRSERVRRQISMDPFSLTLAILVDS